MERSSALTDAASWRLICEWCKYTAREMVLYSGKRTYGKLGVDLIEGIPGNTTRDGELSVVLDLESSLLDTASHGKGQGRREERENDGGLEKHFGGR
jgi:hypothetical protein